MQLTAESACQKTVRRRNVPSLQMKSEKFSRASATPTLKSSGHVRTVRTTNQVEEDTAVETALIEAVPPRERRSLRQLRKTLRLRSSRLSMARNTK